MKYLSQNFATIPQNLAADEWLLEQAAEHGSGVLRIWSPKETAVVLGRGNSLRAEVSVEACEEDGVDILRRTSGGGAVLLMPQCVCYSIILPLHEPGKSLTAVETNQHILSTITKILNSLTTDRVAIAGDTDLVIGNAKVAGSAQRRSRDGILFHGVFLLTADVQTIGRYLKMPTRQPDYRQNRDHIEFLHNAPWSRREVTDAFREGWSANEALEPIAPANLQALTERHSDLKWIGTVP
ncbi:MAG: lipoate-protein ligase A [Limisphaerales bacterium]|jgi:lipoate-protein ligase A